MPEQKLKPVTIHFSNVDVGEDILTFYTSKKVPSLPLRHHGKIGIVGWDIPLQWAVDGQGAGWIGDGLGGALKPCKLSLIEDHIRDEAMKQAWRLQVGLKPSKIKCDCCNGVGWVKVGK